MNIRQQRFVNAEANGIARVLACNVSQLGESENCDIIQQR